MQSIAAFKVQQPAFSTAIQLNKPKIRPSDLIQKKDLAHLMGLAASHNTPAITSAQIFTPHNLEEALTLNSGAASMIKATSNNASGGGAHRKIEIGYTNNHIKKTCI